MANAGARLFKGLIEPHLDALFRAAFRLARNKPDAEDLVQETCVRACQRISTLDDSRNIKAWLLRVLHNVFVDGTRRSERSPVTGLKDGRNRVASFPSTDPDPEESTFIVQREEQLQRAWSKLDRDQRVLLALRAEGYGLSEIGEITGLATDALNARLYRARRSLARHLKDEEANEPEHRLELAK